MADSFIADGLVTMQCFGEKSMEKVSVKVFAIFKCKKPMLIRFPQETLVNFVISPRHIA